MAELAVKYRQDPSTSWWTATMPDVPAVVTQGKTLKEAYDNVRRALSLVREDADEVRLRGRTDWTNRSDLIEDVLQAVRGESDLRVSLIEMEHELERKTRIAVEILITTHRFSFREAGRLLGITGQRVEQISKLLADMEHSSDRHQASEF